MNKLELFPLEKQLENVVLQTYHYNPSPPLVEYLAYFTTLHRFDDRVTYKEAWEKWIQTSDVAAVLENEVKQLQQTGYTGNALAKIYKSARYYYRKKPLTKDPVTEKKKRKKYEGLPTPVLDAMDIHIANSIKSHIVSITHNENNPDDLKMKSAVSPQESYTQFIKTITEPLSPEMEKKYKKTFQNRFFLYRHKLHK